jgi:RNA polymerase sigma-70 factor (ECF subfamily)
MERILYLFVNSMDQEAQELARGLRRRDPDLLDQLIHRYQFRLLRYLVALTGSRETAEDLFQETWVRVLERGHQYSVRWKFEAWLFTIARHLAIDLLRRRRPESLDALIDAGGSTSPREVADPGTPTPLERLSQWEDAQQVAAALAQLSPGYREVLVLRFLEDLELQEISAVVSSPLSTVKSRLYRGLEALRKVLEEGQA